MVTVRSGSQGAWKQTILYVKVLKRNPATLVVRETFNKILHVYKI